VKTFELLCILVRAFEYNNVPLYTANTR